MGLKKDFGLLKEFDESFSSLRDVSERLMDFQWYFQGASRGLKGRFGPSRLSGI